ncbi:cellulose biosynthesis cyclic di-GMP-binding regulatory protein BcsB [Devosia rhizoryzae]|uniref:Cyclic di-GMP-binding protein n=1 Tax=Devosia rhizoryzae TaxID=2774137 RepID=A0ABX7C317_9HYPH|nr:cellulose biosynthesis cyclic di-GMP-binding regulatory protein BcsB [Devosia rhizoryzae]QQR38629.1 cellulose biosynthesis cyclic di-GMP-binding regulatory protein BcsB [Devosia rhizoryzae]
MNKRLWFAAALFATVSLPATAQAPRPFDMSPESDLVVPAPVAPAPRPQPTPAAPQPAPVQTFTRFLLPEPQLRLEGEENSQAVIVYLTEEQAAAAARLEFSYLNALVVAPEVSALVVRINGTEISGQPIASSAAPSAVSIALPSGLLRAGPNIVDFRATQRHRTDCSVDSTYELWTQLQDGNARLVFDAPATGQVTRLADLAAVGVDEEGSTTVRLLQSASSDPQSASAGLQLLQQLAIALRVADLKIETTDKLSAGYEPGVLDVVMLPASALPPEFASAQAQAAAGPLAALFPTASGANVLLVSGPDWPSVRRAGDALLASAPLTPTSPRIDLPTPHPMMLGGQSVSLAELGVETIEFNGRRYNGQLQFELPYDFYAYRYGELELVLDAAYSSDVLPGSEIDIYTNGQIASATPLLRTDGGLLRDTIIRIPMTNLRPGRNEVAISVNLQTQSDAVCSPGWTGQAPARFVLASTSQLRLPDYARAASMPDLLVTAGSGWPYVGTTTSPIAIGSGTDSLVSAMLMVSRIAAASGQVLPVEAVSPNDLLPDQNALVVMPLPEMTPPILAASGVAATALTSAAASTADPLLDQFTTEAPPAIWSGPVNWLAQRVGLDPQDLRVIPQADTLYSAAPEAVVMSQVRRPEGGIWTVLTAADGKAMREGAERLVVTKNWRSIEGRISAIAPADSEVTVLQANNPAVLETQPFSLFNLRLVAANWFSGNILYFAAAIAAGAVLLMLASSFVLTQLGRRQ